MSTPKREREPKEKLRLELKPHEKAYIFELNNHPATKHFSAVCLRPDLYTLAAAVLYLLERVRDDDVGSPP
jgi:hypothetical protein